MDGVIAPPDGPEIVHVEFLAGGGFELIQERSAVWTLYPVAFSVAAVFANKIRNDHESARWTHGTNAPTEQVHPPGQAENLRMGEHHDMLRLLPCGRPSCRSVLDDANAETATSTNSRRQFWQRSGERYAGTADHHCGTCIRNRFDEILRGLTP